MYETKSVGELTAEVPNSIRVFESWKIDYCCGGRTPLKDACASAGRSVQEFVAELSRTATLPRHGFDWQSQSLQETAANICSTYHAYTREELKTIAPIAEKVLGVHGDRHPELQAVVSLIEDVARDILPHMLEEEQLLFPYVNQLEVRAASGDPAATPSFGTVRNPVRTMTSEHERVGELLARLRAVTNDYVPPSSACFSYRELYRRLAELEQQTHEHIHVENNIYFPRAIALDESGGPREAARSEPAAASALRVGGAA